jgi:membrane protein implicated in regulation of membrane protease activity
LIYWKKIHSPEAFGTAGLIGKEGVTEEEVTEESGYVKIGGERWPARPADGKPIAVGVRIIVKTMEGNRLYVSTQTEFQNTKGG